MPLIDSNEVDDIFKDCLLNPQDLDGSVPKKDKQWIPVQGIVASYGMDPEKVQNHSNRITEMLDQLSDDFKQSGGGGHTFLNACNDKDDAQWTGLHQRMEQLFCLGIAIGKVGYLMPKRMWAMLPGNMPYACVLDQLQTVKFTMGPATENTEMNGVMAGAPGT